MATEDPLQEARVQAFLDDKLQWTTDLDHLDTLLASVELQRTQLQAQLDDATLELDAARRTGTDRQAALARQIDEFQQLQQSIDTRLQIVASSDAPDEAIRRLEPPLKKLHRVDLAQSYLLLLQDVEVLRAEARSRLPQSPKQALEPYTRLKQLSVRLRELQAAAGGAATHLVAHVGAVTDALWDEMKRTMVAEMDAVLARSKWPQGVEPDLVPVPDEWRDAFEKLLDLQVPEVLYSPGTVPVLPIDTMAQIWAKEFRFHFLSDRPTSNNRLIGQHCFPWVLRLVSTWEDFFRDNFAFLLASKFQGTAVAGRAVYMDPVCALITSLLPVVREKVLLAADEAVADPAFLSSLLTQLMTFDEELRSRFGYDDSGEAGPGGTEVGNSGLDRDKGWAGLTAEVLDRHFVTWLRAEKDFALARFKVVVDSADAWSFDYDYGGGGVGRTKPTHSAIRVADLLRSVTTLYERLRPISHKLPFLIDIQLTILDGFYDRLGDALNKYYALTSTVGRTLHGATKEELAALEGTGALETLCKVYGSADHMLASLDDWSNEEFFVIFYEELRFQTKNAEDHQATLAGGRSYAEVKSLTVGAADSGSGVIFDETIAAYKTRRDAAHEGLVKSVIHSNYQAFRPYVTRALWSTVGDESSLVDPSQLAITPELDVALKTMKQSLDFLHRTLGTAAFRRLWRSALGKLDESLWKEVLICNKFTALGAAQFARDLRAIAALVERYIPDGAGALASVQDGARLLSLPLEPSEGGEGGKEITLGVANDLAFKDNTEAKLLLEKLGLYTLNPVNARHILQRRVEINE